MTNPTPTPVPPVIPTAWTPSALISYVAAFALFVVGLLTLGGVTVPSSVPADIQLYSGLAITAAAPIVALVAQITKSRLIRELVAVGVPVEVARKV